MRPQPFKGFFYALNPPKISPLNTLFNMKESASFQIYDFMLQLNIKSYQLLTYALIYSLAPKGEYVELKILEISERLNVTNQSILTAIAQLLHKDLIKREYVSNTGVLMYKYKIL